MKTVQVCCYVLVLIASVSSARWGMTELDVPNQAFSINSRSQVIKREDLELILESMTESNIEQLNFQENAMPRGWIEKITSHENFHNIRHLILPRNNLRDAGAKAIAKVLKYTEITDMNLSGNNIVTKGIEAIVIVLEASKITDIDLSHNVVGDRMVGAMTLAVGKIQRLNLHSTSITSPTGIINALVNYPMTDLNIGGNHLTEQSIKKLAGALKFSKIINLDLENIKLTENGLGMLAEGLKGCRVRSLNLAKNKLGDKGAETIAEILKYTVIENLNLDDNLISESGGELIAQVLRNTFITELTLKNINLEEVKTQLEENKDRNEMMYLEFEKQVNQDLDFVIHRNRLDASYLIDFTKIVTGKKGPWSKFFLNKYEEIYGQSKIELFVKEIDKKLAKSLSRMEIDLAERVLLLLECHLKGLEDVVRILISKTYRAYYRLREKVTNQPHELDNFSHPAVYILSKSYWPNVDYTAHKQQMLEIFTNPEWDVFMNEQQLGDLAENYGKGALLELLNSL